MIISLNWLKRYLPELEHSVEEIDRLLTAAGLEVEGVENQAKPYEKLTIAKVLTCEKHPEADKLSITNLNDGEKEIQVVCGAPNVAAGQTVVLAPVGSTLPDGEGGVFKLKKAKIRGVESFGMICAEDEIGLGTSHDGIMELDSKHEAGTLFTSLGLYDVVFEVNVTPNRPDALSHMGVARELGALTGVPLVAPSIEVETSSEKASDKISVELTEGVGCTRYVARYLENVKVGPSPEWLQGLLNAIGIRPINNVVDITNFVLMETGQPLHAFDLDKLSGEGVVIRGAKAGETLTTLDEEERKLQEGDLVIADSEKPACLGGVMGGLDSGVAEGTTRVLLETAWFEPGVVRRLARRQKVHSDSSHRFERGADPINTDWVSQRAAALIVELCGATLFEGSVEKQTEAHPSEAVVVNLRIAKAASILGYEPPVKEVRDAFVGIGLEVLEESEAELKFKIPGFRPDLIREIDLIEEIARLLGFDRIPTIYPKLELVANPLPAVEALSRKIRRFMAAQGLNEGCSLRFDSQKHLDKLFEEGDDRLDAISLENPLSDEWSVMPTTLISSMLKSVSLNLRNQEKSVALFEVGKAFFKHREKKNDKHPGTREELIVSGAIAGEWKSQGAWNPSTDAGVLEFKAILANLFAELGANVDWRRPENTHSYLHPLRQVDIVVNGKVIGVLGEVHPKVAEAFEIEAVSTVFEIALEPLLASQKRPKVFKAFSKYGKMSRDVSLLVASDLDSKDVSKIIMKSKAKNLVDVVFHSEYTGEGIEEGKKAVLFKCVYQNAEKTLTDKEVNKAQERIIKNLENEDALSIR